MKMRRRTKNDGNEFAFLGKSVGIFSIFLIIATVGFVVEKLYNYKYVVIQKQIQSGIVMSNWQDYMELGINTILISLILVLVKVFLTMWIEMIQKVNFHHFYNGVLQEEGKFQAALKDLLLASAKVFSLVEFIETIINSFYVVILMGIVSMSVPQYIGMASILFSGIGLGLLRGKLQAMTDFLNASVQALQQKLSTNFMISSNVLGERLNDVKSNYWRRIFLQVIKNGIQKMPEVVKVMVFVTLFYNIITTGMPENEIYPYTYVIMTAYGYTVILAANISNLLEYLFKMITYKQDPELQEIQAEMKKRNEEISKNQNSLCCNEDGITIKRTFRANLIRPNGEEAFFDVPNDLSIRKGTLILLEGENGTGKSRFCKLIKAIKTDTYSYDSKTGITDCYHENFIREGHNIDFNLIKYLAEGLGIERIPKTKDSFLKLTCFSINSADRQMLILLQILYFAIKEQNSQKLIILDEIFANLSLERTQKVLPFLVSELAKIDACTIVVSHSHKEEVKKFITHVWVMKNESNKVVIKSKPV